MIFVSKGYFKSKNCVSHSRYRTLHHTGSATHPRPASHVQLREVRYTLDKAKPIVLVHDSAVCD